ncbi:MAG: helix-turn-helix domain-containing protein [bacterium]|nr:helix-turn-helix domain-containing protein [bacterium]
MFEKYLKDIGLSDKEAAVYLALLSFDKALVTEIADKANIKRPTTYVILESLAKKGLVSEANIGKKTFYIAEPPEKLGLFVERQIHLLEENKKSLDIIVPQLKGIQREQGEKPVVQFFEGKEGVISSSHNIFSKKINDEPVYIVYSKDTVMDMFSEKEAKEMRELRISRGIKSKAIYISKEGEKPSDETGDRIKIDENKYPIKSDITIYGDQVRVAVFGKRLSGIFVKNQELADTLKSLIKYIFDHK